MENSKNCQFKTSRCGKYGIYSDDTLGCAVLKRLEDDFAKDFNADIVISECDLICNRANVPLDLDGFICSYHRFTLGKYYKIPTTCKFYEHPVASKAKGMKISWRLYKFVKSTDSTFVLGSLICKPCQQKLNEMIYEEPDEDAGDTNYIPQKCVMDEKEKLKRREQLDSLADIFGLKRVRYQINSDIENMSIGSLNYFRGVHEQIQNKVTETFCYLVAPDQETKMKEVLEMESYGTDTVIEHLKEAFNACTSKKARLSVLMLVPKSYKKAKVCEIFDCTFYEVERARKILKLYGTCGTEPEEKRNYSRLTVVKAQHFIDFLFTTGILQEVAYGTTKLKLDSGDKITVSNTILNGIYEHAVKEYIIHCREINYCPLGRSTLLKMLDKMKPHTRKKLSGVDSFVVEGIEAFEVISIF
jgi:hypothetical protein